MCFVYGHQAWIFRAIAMLPSQVIDWLTVWSDQSDFKGVRHRYDGKIEKSE